MIVLIAALILLAVVGGKAGAQFVKGLIMLAFGLLLAVAGCSIV